jgi:S1-C subfamily serine protease
MKKFFIIFLLAISTACCNLRPKKRVAPPPQTMADLQLYKSVGNVYYLNKDDVVFSGTVFAVDAHRLVSVDHICSDSKVPTVFKVEYIDANERLATFSVFKVTKVDAAKDLCILEAPNHPLRPLKFGDFAKLRRWERVYTIGAPRNYFPVLMECFVVSKDSHEAEYGPFIGKLMTSCPVTGGSSGGPVVNAKGEVLGIVSMKDGEHDEGAGRAARGLISVGATSTEIIEFLK